MKLISEPLPDVALLESHLFEDERGSFLKVFNRLSDYTRAFSIQQINYVDTSEKHTLRGLHYQTGKAAEAKLFRVVSGKAQLAFIDLREQSRTYLESKSVILDKANKALLIPRGMATGYLTLAAHTRMLYLSDNDYTPNQERGIRWDDAVLNIKWLTDEPILSKKDLNWEDFKP